MADAKTYNVVYNISTNVAQVEEGLKSIENFANILNNGLANVKKSAQEMNDLVAKFKTVKPIPISLDIKPFRAELRILESEVSQAAARMQQAMREVFMPGAPNSIKTNYLKSQLEGIRAARKAIQNELNQLAGLEHTGAKGEKIPAMNTETRKSGTFKYHKGSLFDKHVAEGKQEEYDRLVKMRRDFIEEYNRQEAEIQSVLDKAQKKGAQGAAVGPSVANPRMASGLLDELKKLVTKTADKLPKVPLQFSFDTKQLNELLKTELETPHLVTITPRFDESALERMRSRLKNLGVEAINTAAGTMANPKTYTGEILNSTESKLLESMRKPLTATENQRLQELKEDKLLKKLERAKQKISTAKSKMDDEPTKANKKAYNKAISDYKNLLADSEIQSTLRLKEELERKSFRASSQRILSDREATQGARWQRVYDKAKATFENRRVAQEVRDAAERTMGQAEKEMTKLRAKRGGFGPGVSQAPVTISVGINPEIAMADLARLKAFIENYKIALNIKAVSETNLIKTQVKNAVDKNKNKVTKLTGPHIPVPITLDTTKLDAKLTSVISSIESKTATIKGQISFTGITANVKEAIALAEGEVSSRLLARAAQHAEIINNGGQLPLQGRAKETVEDLRAKLEQAISKIPKSLTNIWVDINIRLIDETITAEQTRLQEILNAKPLNVLIRLVPEENKDLIKEPEKQAAATKKKTRKKKATAAEPVAPPPVPQVMGDLQTTLMTEVNKVAEKITEVTVNARLNYEGVLTQLKTLQNTANRTPITIPVEPIIVSPAAFKDRVFRGINSLFAEPGAKVDPLAGISPLKNAAKLTDEQNAGKSAKIKVGLDLSLARRQLDFFINLNQDRIIVFEADFNTSKAYTEIERLREKINTLGKNIVISIYKPNNIKKEITKIQEELDSCTAFIKIRFDLSALKQELTALQYELDARKVYIKGGFDSKQITEQIALLQAKLLENKSTLQIGNNLGQILADLNLIQEKAATLKGDLTVTFKDNGSLTKLAEIQELEKGKKANIELMIEALGNLHVLDQLERIVDIKTISMELNLSIEKAEPILAQIQKLIDLKEIPLEVKLLMENSQAILSQLTKLIDTKKVEINVKLLTDTANNQAKALVENLNKGLTDLKITLNTTEATAQVEKLIEQIKTLLATPLNINLKTNGTVGTTGGENTATGTATSSTAKPAKPSAPKTTAPVTDAVPPVLGNLKPYRPYKPVISITEEESGESKPKRPRIQDDVIKDLLKRYGGGIIPFNALVPVPNNGPVPERQYPNDYSTLRNRLLQYAKGKSTGFLKMLEEHHPTLKAAMNMLQEEGLLSTTDIKKFSSADKYKILERAMRLMDQNTADVPLMMFNEANSYKALMEKEAEVARITQLKKDAFAKVSQATGLKSLKGATIEQKQNFISQLQKEYGSLNIPVSKGIINLQKQYEKEGVERRRQLEEERRLKVQQSIEAKKQKLLEARRKFQERAAELVGHDGKLLKFVTDNRKSFMAASDKLGFTPTKYTITASKANYINEVVAQLRRNGVTIPSQFITMQKDLNALAEAKRIKGEQLQAAKMRREASMAVKGDTPYRNMGYGERFSFLRSLMAEYHRRGLSTTRLASFYNKEQKKNEEWEKKQRKLAEEWEKKQRKLEEEAAKRAELERKASVQNSIASRSRSISVLRNKTAQGLLSLTGDGKIAKFIADNRRHFINAAHRLGYTAPSYITDALERQNYLVNGLNGLNAADAGNYLREVIQSLESKGITVPTTLKNELQRLNAIVKAQELKNLRNEAAAAARSATGLTGSVKDMSLEDKADFYKALMQEYNKRGLPFQKMLGVHKKIKAALQAEQVGVAPTSVNAAEQLRNMMSQAQQRTGMDFSKLTAPDKAQSWLRYYNALEQAYAENNGKVPQEITSQKKAKESEWKSWSDRRQSMRKNVISSYVTSAEMRNLIADNWYTFRRAAIQNNIASFEAYKNLDDRAKLKFLQDVRDRIFREARKDIPMGLDKEINRLQSQISSPASTGGSSGGSGGSGGNGPSTSRRGGSGGGERERSFYDKARKWSYPFSGQTSFGVRTPMMVDMAKGMGVMFAIGGAMSAIGDSFSQAMEYQNTMETTRAILQHGTDTFGTTNYRHMEGIIRDVGVRTKFSAPEVASAARFLAMAGYNIEDINNSIRPVADLALIGDTDLGETADKMTNIMTTFGISSDRMREVANILTTTATRSNTDLMMLAEAAKYGGGVANMYGKNDPNLFADTMALFGVMGNAGIQASSAGTGLRMMYQNIFNPNKKQKAVLDALEKRGVKTLNADGSYRSMAEFIRDVAKTITDPKEMAAVVSTLFRITAQPAANAAIMAAVGGDADAYDDTMKKFGKIEENLMKKGGLDKLAELMEANRNAIYGNISSDVAEKKQNTIQGLWAQVTSTFTEGIVKAFETRSGGFEGMLKGIRDFLAKPETVTMLRNLLDLIVEIGKIMGYFVGVWANFYHTFPNAIKLWMTLQMVFTQFGYLLSPFTQLLGAIDRFGGTLKKFLGGGLALRLGGAATAGSGLTNAALLASGAALFSGPRNRQRTTPINPAASGNLQAMLLNGVSMAGNTGYHVATVYPYTGLLTQFPRTPTPIPPSGIRPGGSIWSPQSVGSLSTAALIGADYGIARQREIAAQKQHEQNVRKRAWQMYGLPKGWRSIKKAWNVGSMASSFISFMPSLVSGLGKILISVTNTLMSTLALLINPFTIVAGAAVGLGYGIYKLNQYINGQSEAQLRAFENTQKLADQAHFEREKNAQWFHQFMQDPESEFFQKYGNGLKGQIELSKKGEATLRYEAMMEARKKNYPELYDDLTKDISHQRTKMAAERWKSSMLDNDISRLALGGDYLERVSNTLNPLRDINHTGKDAGLLSLGAKLYYWLKGDKKNAQMVERQRLMDMLKVEGAYDPVAKKAIGEFEKIYTQYIDGKLKEEEYQKQAEEIRNKYIPNLSKLDLIDANSLTNKQILEYSDYSATYQYQEGLKNFLEAALDPETSGSPFAFANAIRMLTSKTIEENTPKWKKYIGDVINNSTLTTTLNGVNGEIKDMELKLMALPDGSINVDGIVRQVQDVVSTYKKNLQDVANISAGVYKILVDNGLIEGSPEKAKEFISEQVGNNISHGMASTYFDKYLSKNSGWVGIKNEFLDWIFGTEEQRNAAHHNRTTGGLLSRVKVIQQIYNKVISDTATNVMGAEFMNPSSEQTSDDKNNTPDHSDLGVNQNGYASSYTAPHEVKQIAMNFNSPLVQFSNTAISSSAEEHDIMMAVEEKVANVVLMTVTSALNQSTETYV